MRIYTNYLRTIYSLLVSRFESKLISLVAYLSLTLWLIPLVKYRLAIVSLDLRVVRVNLRMKFVVIVMGIIHSLYLPERLPRSVGHSCVHIFCEPFDLSLFLKLHLLF